MKLTIRDRLHHDTNATERYVARRSRFALGRLAHLVEVLHVGLVDVNGPKGGVDTQCTVRVQTHQGPPLFVRQTGATVPDTIDRALARMAVALRRAADRKRMRRPRWSTRPAAMKWSAS